VTGFPQFLHSLQLPPPTADTILGLAIKSSNIPVTISLEFCTICAVEFSPLLLFISSAIRNGADGSGSVSMVVVIAKLQHCSEQVSFIDTTFVSSGRNNNSSCIQLARGVCCGEFDQGIIYVPGTISH
jgi:hypothetical protein